MHALELQHPAVRRRNDAPSRRWDVILGALALMAVAAYAASALLAADLGRPDATERFTPVTAAVEGAEVVAQPPTALGQTFRVRLHCRYPWEGRECITTTESTFEEAPPLGYLDATDAAARFEPGTSVAVLVDPRDPQHALIDNRTRHSPLPVVLALALTGASAFLALVGWRGWPLATRAPRG